MYPNNTRTSLATQAGLAIVLFALAGMSTQSTAQSEVDHNSAFLLPVSYAAVSSQANSNGYAAMTLLDVSGESIFRAQQYQSNLSLGFAIDSTGHYADSLESGTSVAFPVDSNLTFNNLWYPTYPDTVYTQVCKANVIEPANNLFMLDHRLSRLNYGNQSGPAWSFALSSGAPVGTTPVAMTGSPVTQHYVVISQNVPYGVACNNIPHDVSQVGNATTFDSSNFTQGPAGGITLGKCPVFGVTSADGKRAFVLNRGDDSVSVINLVTNVLDRTIALPITKGTHAGPIHAEYLARGSKVLVSNYENDTVSIINAQLDQWGSDGPSFGSVVTVDLWDDPSHPGTGKHPSGITVLPDGSRAYVANQEEGSISVIDLKLNAAVGTLTPAGPGFHPRSVAATAYSSTNSTFAKIYIEAPELSSVPSIYATDDRLWTPSCPNQLANCTYWGDKVVEVHLTTQDTSTGTNSQFSSRLSGAGEPCETWNPNPHNLAECRAH